MEDAEHLRTIGAHGAGASGGGDELLTLDEVATLLKVPRSWIYERTRRRLIPHVKLGKYLRFPRSALVRWVQGLGGGPEPVAPAPLGTGARVSRRTGRPLHAGRERAVEAPRRATGLDEPGATT